MAIDPQLEKIVTSLQVVEGKISVASRSNGKRPWVNFSDVKRAGKFDFPGMREIFTRKKSNDDYGKLRANPKALQKDLVTAKLSADWLAATERDYCARTRSRVRTMVHATVTSPASLTNTKGALRRNTVDWLGRILAEQEATQ